MVESRLAQVKNKALMWIYPSEWLIVASTSMVSGVILWTLMARRKLYREAGMSRLSLRLGED